MAFQQQSFNSHFRTTWVSQYQNGNSFSDFKACHDRMMWWQWY